MQASGKGQGAGAGTLNPKSATQVTVAICYPTDPAGHVPSGIDSFIRGVLKWAPQDLQYTLFGATSDPQARPVGQEATAVLGERTVRFLPLVSVDPRGKRGALPLTVKYMWALRKHLRRSRLADFAVFDFHRIEPVLLFKHDPRPKNVVLHTDYAILRDKKSDILWQHWPWLYERVEGVAFGALDRVFSVHRGAAARYVKTYPHWENKFLFLPTWVDSSVFYPARSSAERGALRAAVLRQHSIPADAQLLVFVGRLDHSKDPLLLIEAFGKASAQRGKLHLLMIGDGILRAQVERACREGGFGGRISLLGARRSTEIADVLRASDLLVMSSVYEGMPIVALEALAAGVPVVSPNVGELSLVVHDGVNGCISQERSPGALAAAIGLALDKIQAMRGTPCELAVAPYHARNVLSQVYENHRRQARFA